jgi:sulfocyanin
MSDGLPAPQQRGTLMVRLTTLLAALAGMTAGPVLPAPSGAQTAVAADTTPGSKWLKWDEATKTVTFELVAGADGAAKSPFNFNGYTDGEAALIVPPGSNVVMNFVQKDGTPHSAELIADKDPMPNMAGEPAIPRAYTNKAVEGLPQEAKDVMRFTAPESGSYRIFCGVPGHGLSGMWIRFTVDPAAKAPRFETKQSG